MRKKARAVSTLRGSRGPFSCGRNSDARAIGPAARYGKKATYTEKSSSDAGRSVPRYTSMT